MDKQEFINKMQEKVDIAKSALKDIMYITDGINEGVIGVIRDETNVCVAFDGEHALVCGNCKTKIFHPSEAIADAQKYHRYCSCCGMKIKWPYLI